METSGNYGLDNFSKVFISVTYGICIVQGAIHFLKDIPVTPFIILTYIGILSCFLAFQKRLLTEDFNFYFGCLTTLMVSAFAFFTGGFEAPVFRWILPIFIFVSYACKNKKYNYYLYFLAFCISTLLVTDHLGFRVFNFFDPKKAKAINIFSTVFSILVSVLMIKFYRKDREGLERNLYESQERNDLIIHASNTGIWDWVDINKDEVFWSQKIYQILKLDPKEVNPGVAKFNSMLADGELERTNEIVMKQFEQGDTFQVTMKMQRSDGEYIWVNSSGIVLKNKKGENTRMVGAIQDITELVLAKEQVELEKERALEASAAKSRFLSNMTHEIRTPLNAILGLTEILKDKMTNSDDFEVVNDIHSSGEMLFSLVSDILDVNKIQENKIQLELAPTPLESILNELSSAYHILAERKGITFNLKTVNISDCIFDLDVIKIKQVLNNLITNAFKFTDTGSVDLYCEYTEGKLKMSVKDSGIGIPEDQLQNVFDSFLQIDNKLSKKYRGTGLGLYIVKELVSLMGGQIQVRSEQEKGTEFYFSINTKMMDKVSTHESLDIQGLDLSVLRILVAEDNLLNTKVMKKYLDGLNVNYTFVENGKLAVEITEKDKFDVVFMDLQMPIMDGLEASEKIIERDKEHAPYIIALTANATQESKEKAIGLGMKDFLTKPIQKKIIQKILESYLLNSKNSNLDPAVGT